VNNEQVNLFPGAARGATCRGNRPGVESFLPECHDVLDVLDVLIKPVREFVSRDSKQVRAQLVRIGFDLCQGNKGNEGDEAGNRESLLDCLACVVEALHAGSLVIDDIQDSSDVRRGEPALHLQIGVPLAINAANWLYFWPADLVRQQGLPPQIELEIYRLFHATMMRAHQGQALDLGHDLTQVPRESARDISLATIELKTGELMAMCAEFGAIAGGAHEDLRKRLAAFGRRFGVALQMFNDIGEVVAGPAAAGAQRSFRRPSWVWAVAAKELAAADYDRFQAMMREPGALESYDRLARHEVIGEAVRLACEEMEQTLALVAGLAEAPQDVGHARAVSAVRELARKVMSAYA
jgi:geranylgeranyl pyrophosphate synthase